jgi:hypothetical protein
VLLSGREGCTLHWKVYAVVMGLLSFASYYVTGLPRIWELIDFLVFLLMYAGLISFAWDQPLFHRRFWQVSFPVMVLWNVVYMFVIPAPEPPEVADMDQFALAVLSAIIVVFIYIPWFVALYRYAYKREDIWK